LERSKMPLMNWDNPPELDAPKRRQLRAQFADRMKLVRLKESRAKGPKKHSTNKERSHHDRTKYEALVHRVAENRRKIEAHKLAVSAYWRGELPHYPKL